MLYTIMKRTRLTDKQVDRVKHCLEAAGAQFEQDAQDLRMTPSLAKTFEVYAKEAQEIRELLDEGYLILATTDSEGY